MTARTDESLHTGQMHCHYCLAVNALPATCPQCGKKLALFGLVAVYVLERLIRLWNTYGGWNAGHALERP